MTLYDDAEVSCPMCSVALEAAALCECDDGPLCCRCHRVHHVEDWMTNHGRQASA